MEVYTFNPEVWRKHFEEHAKLVEEQMAYDEFTNDADRPASLEVLAGKSLHDPRMPIRRKLEIRLAQLQTQVNEIADALRALDSNPEFEKLHDTLTRVSRFL